MNQERPFRPRWLFYRTARLLALTLALFLGLPLLAAGRFWSALPASAGAPSWCDTAGQDALPEIECRALEALYHSTDGPNWTDNSGWLDSTAVCTEWHGVACAAGQVRRLSLVANNLRGPLPGEIGDLSALTHLDLTGNLLNGAIPPALGRLTTLSDLSLGGNQFEGQIPTELGQLPELAALDLGDNRLSGAIPAQLGSLPGLSVMLYLDGNQLEGPIPAAVCDLSPALSSLDYNKLDYFTTVESCDDAFPQWQQTQTASPAGVSVTALNVRTEPGTTAVSGEVLMQWLPATYRGAGGYEIMTRRLAGGGLQSRARIEDKTADSIQLTIAGDPNAYAYSIRAWTNAHDNNQSRLISDGEEARMGYIPPRTLDGEPDLPALYLPALALLALLLITAIAIPALKRR